MDTRSRPAATVSAIGRNARVVSAGTVGAGIVGAGIVAAGLLGAGPASAAEPSVDFNGGCALLGIGEVSRPDTPTLRVTAGSNLWLVNHLGVDATVMLDGRSTGTVPARQSTRVTLAAEETATVVMVPTCLVPLLPDTQPLTVTVASAGGTPSAPPSTPGGTTPSTAPDPPASPGRPQPTPVTNSTPPAPAPRASAQAVSHQGRVPVPGAGPVTATRRAPVAAPPTRSGTTPPAAPPRAAAPGLDVPVAPLTDERGFRYSLALIATVLIVGTGMAAIRLLASGRHVGAHRGR